MFANYQEALNDYAYALSVKIPPGIRVFNKIADFRSWRRQLLLDRQTLGYVPTMGALHQGHLALVTAAKQQCDHVALTIFVNPAQFAPNEDLASYPRTLQSDLDQLAALGPHVASAVLVPQVQEMYPTGIELDVSKQKGAFVEVKGLSHQLEGITRPHFFRGVATVVTKFLNIVQPEHVYFGQKDIQQCFVIRRMLQDLHVPVQMHICPTIREEDGLAMSSRNTYLSPTQRTHALCLSKALQTMEKMYRDGVRHAPTLISAAKDVIETTQRQVETLGQDWQVKLDYVNVNSPHDLSEIRDEITDGAIMSLAVFVGKTRLIDNIVVDVSLDS
ncbi:pantoate/beta-alanine ligase [Radiomyces spectabilis]|uniref:pantoate/beta-alanine ligase n=1 Tax=Radiomyces spectabilis TaxID=64574 RepID=UPI00221EE40B|nr:pantoate/beta-alanine ligase [Radiomyces spectabilis]KAI8384620.1 pantoate/beta-alanine ligase [Radiomyces spectabilis]